MLLLETNDPRDVLNDVRAMYHDRPSAEIEGLRCEALLAGVCTHTMRSWLTDDDLALLARLVSMDERGNLLCADPSPLQIADHVTFGKTKNTFRACGDLVDGPDRIRMEWFFRYCFNPVMRRMYS